MTFYEVIVTRDITESCTVRVEADDPEAAQELAVEKVQNGDADDSPWEIDMGSCGSSSAYATGCTETEVDS